MTSGGVGLVLVAAGRGTRLGADRPKALVPLGAGDLAEPLVTHALRGALRCTQITHVVVVAPPDPEGMEQLTAAVHLATSGPDAPRPDRERVSHPDRERASRDDRGRASRDDRGRASRDAHVRVVAGGAERTDSVALGLAAMPAEVGVVLVHDAARALTPVEVFDRVVHAVHSGHAAVTPALPVTDTVKQVVADGRGVEHVVATLDRSALRAVQTPQGFLRETLERAHAGAVRTGAAPATDDCGLVEAHGGRVTVVEGSPRSLKITTRHDLEVAASWLSGQRPPRELSRPVLVVLGGLPGVGKTTVARPLCRALGAAHLRVDTVEQALVRGGLTEDAVGAQGYAATYAVAADQLAVGTPVVADTVGGLTVVREAWDRVAEAAGARQVRVLLECSDVAEHRRRVEGREADIEGHRLPSWSDVQEREFEPWTQADLTLDTTVLTTAEVVRRIVELVEEDG